MYKVGEYILGKKERKRKPIPSRLKREITSRPVKCKWCRKNPVQEVHHIDGNPENIQEDNLIGLCGICHIRATRGEINKEQLWRGLGIKRVRRARKSPTKKRPRRKKTPVEKIIFG